MDRLEISPFKIDGYLPMALQHIPHGEHSYLAEPDQFNQLPGLRTLMKHLSEATLQEIYPDQSVVMDEESKFCLYLSDSWAQSGATLELTNCRDFRIVYTGPLGGDLTIASRNKFFITLRSCRNFELEHLNFYLGRNQLFLDSCAFLSIKKCCFSQAEGYGVILLNSHHFLINECQFEACLASGIMAVGECSHGVVESCLITSCKGDYNWDAGLHLCATSPVLGEAEIPEQVHEHIPITGKTNRPQHIVVQSNIFSNCRAQAIYVEGAYNCLFQNNLLHGNNKEGICFDWGSIANIFIDNDVVANGARRDMTESSINADFLSRYAVLPDQSSSLKLPGVSFDNAYLNVVRGNRITSNYGGGIKMVRSAQGNVIEKNSIVRNTMGRNIHVPHSNGISLLCLGGLEEFSEQQQPLLDFLPSALNHILCNDIVGHSADVFQDTSCFGNEIKD